MALSLPLRPLTPTDAERVTAFIRERWGAELVVAHGSVFFPHNLPGFAVWEGEAIVGLLTYHLAGGECEIVTLDSRRPAAGIGTALIETVKVMALQAHCRRLWLITTNDNLSALRFYQKRGFELVAIHRNALEHTRLIKPQLSLLGEHDIPLRDEIELELRLG
jgi:GNAT superfamily N-acetyltransferase